MIIMVTPGLGIHDSRFQPEIGGTRRKFVLVALVNDLCGQIFPCLYGRRRDAISMGIIPFP